MATESEWMARVAAWRASGMTARAFCGERGFSLSSLYMWSSRAAHRSEQARQTRPRVQLARVVRDPTPRREADIIVELGALRVKLTYDVRNDMLECILGTLARTTP